MTAPDESTANDKAQHDALLEKYTEIASLAHEIKNPLSTLNLNLQLLAEDFRDPQTQKERRALQKFEALQKECRRLEQILNDFLRYAKLTDLSFESVDVNDVIHELIELHRPRITAAGILLRDDLGEDLPSVRLDKDLFKQALLNLLINAQHAMPAGGELILKTRADGPYVRIDVIDTGAGMSKETLAKIFKPFYSTRKEGSGLGLPTAKKIVEAHHGKLYAESEPNRGTAFTIQLPAAPQ